MVGKVTVDEAWAELANIGEEVREKVMELRYKELAKLDEEARRGRLRPMANVEYRLPDKRIRHFHLSRLRVWLGMDRETAQRVAASYEAVMKEMPGDIGTRRVAIVQTVASSLSPGEQEQLHSLVPHAFGEGAGATAEVVDTPSAEPQTKAAKPWWAFWRT